MRKIYYCIFIFPLSTFNKDWKFITSKEIIQKKYNPDFFWICKQNLELIQIIQGLTINKKGGSYLISGPKGIGKKYTIIWCINKNHLDYLFIDSSLFIKEFYEYKKLNKSTENIFNFLLSFNLVIFDSIEEIMKKPKITNFLISICKQAELSNTKIFFIYNNESEIFNKSKSKINNYLSEKINIKEHSDQDLKIIINYFVKKNNPNIKFTSESIDFLIETLGNNIQTIINNILNLSTVLENKNHTAIIGKDEIKNAFYNIQTKTKNLELLNSSRNQQIKTICKKIKCDYEEIFKKSRKKEIILNRNIIIYLLKRKYNFTYKKLGDIFNKNHSTIIHSIKYIEKKLEDKDFEKYIDTLL